jgi:hypothetical protein
MNPPLKTTIFLIIGILLAILVIWFAFSFFQNTSQHNTSVPFFNFFAGNNDTIDGGFTQNNTDDNDGEDGTTSDTDENILPPLLFQVFSEPVSGATIVTLPNTTALNTHGSAENTPQSAVRLIERATGHVFLVPFDTLKSKRITNTTIPGIYDSFWDTTGEYVFTRSAAETTIKGIGMQIIEGDEDPDSIGTITALYRHDNILDTDTNPSRDALYILKEADADARGMIVSFDGSSYQDVFYSPFSEWLVDWAEDEYVYLTTKASATVPGYLYYTRIGDSTLYPLLSEKNGLTTRVNSYGTKVLFSESTRDTLSLSILSNKKEVSLPFNTLPEKCVWDETGIELYCAVPFRLQSAAYPDDWYKGIISFNDGFWYMNTETGEYVFLASPETYGAQIDAVSPTLSEDGNYLLFINKKDMTPWVLNIAEALGRINY